MDPEHFKRMAESMPSARYHFCPQGSHDALYDDQERYFAGLIEFIRNVDAGRF